MKISEHLQGARRLFLDTAPIIYFVEGNLRYLPLVEYVFEQLDNSGLLAITSPITLAECLVIPYQNNRPDIREAFVDLITGGNNVLFTDIDQLISEKAAELRARYRLTLTDALQVAVALISGCDTFLTNDLALKRITELRIIVLDELEPESASG